jgi:hypothetical protein
LISPFPNFAFAVRRRGGRPRSRKQMPSWPGKAPVRRRCQGRWFCVHRSAAESLDRRSRRIRRRIWPGSAARGNVRSIASLLSALGLCGFAHGASAGSKSGRTVVSTCIAIYPCEEFPCLHDSSRELFLVGTTGRGTVESTS